MAMFDSDYENHFDSTTQMEFEWGTENEFMVDASIEWQFEGFDGIGSYEYHGQKCFDQGDAQWEIGNVKFTVWDENSNEVELDEPTKEKILQHIYDNATPDFD